MRSAQTENLIETIRAVMEQRAHDMGVELNIDDMNGRMAFAIARHDNASPGQGALVITELLKMADDADVEVYIDVRAGEPALLRYYHQFGFRLIDGDCDDEENEVLAIAAEREAWTAGGHDLDDLGVTTMFRDRWSGPLKPKIQKPEQKRD